MASASPRRKELMLALGYEIEVIPSKVEEVFPENLALEKVPEYLAELKASSLANQYPLRTIVAADTVVILNKEILGKPTDHKNAVDMLKKLSGKRHEVITGVCVCYKNNKETFSDLTEVYFKPLNDSEIDYYVTRCEPFDKAGAYGVQEWIGYIGVEKMVGSFYNVMGLPVNKVYETLNKITYY